MSDMQLAVGLALLVVSAAPAPAIELHPVTVRAWDDYVQNLDRKMQARIDGRERFLWTDAVPGRADRLRGGEVFVAPVVGRGTWQVPNGLIHDWIGAVFIPDATLDDLFAVVHDFDRYKDLYKPVVADSRTLACNESEQRFSMIWQRKILFVDAAVEAQYAAHEFADGRRGYSIAASTRVQEIENYGRRDERLLPVGQGNGFIWRVRSIARYEQRDGGVYLELEAIVLTREVPPSLRWIVNPVVNRLSISSLTTTLLQTRDAIRSTIAARVLGEQIRPLPCQTPTK